MAIEISRDPSSWMRTRKVVILSLVSVNQAVRFLAIQLQKPLCFAGWRYCIQFVVLHCTAVLSCTKSIAHPLFNNVKPGLLSGLPSAAIWALPIPLHIGTLMPLLRLASPVLTTGDVKREGGYRSVVTKESEGHLMSCVYAVSSSRLYWLARP